MMRNTPSNAHRAQPKAADREKGWPKLLRDVDGMEVRTSRKLSTGMMDIPAGTVCTIERHSNGWHLLSLRTAPCACCGVAVRVSRVSWLDVDPVQGN